MDLAAIAAELYGMPLADFTAARNERAKAAKAQGDSLVAKQIARLAKPSAAAWAVNMLARERPEAVREVVGLGESLRTAQAERDAEALRRLGADRQKVISAVVGTVREVARARGAAVSDAVAADVEQTLRAAMTDPEAAAAVGSGQLVRALSSNGLEPVDLSDAVAVPGALPPPPKPAAREPAHEPAAEPAAEHRRAARERDREREEAADAERDAVSAEAALEELEHALAGLSTRKRELSAELDELRDRVGELEHGLAAAQREAADAERSRKLAVRLAQQRRRAADRARERLEELSGESSPE